MISISNRKKPADGEVPVGFGMSLAMNQNAIKRFGELSKEEQDVFIERAGNVKTKQQMTKLTDSLTTPGEEIL